MSGPVDALPRIDITNLNSDPWYSASRQWKAVQVVVFPRINTAIGVGKLYLGVGTTKLFVLWFGQLHYLPWRSSRSESLSVRDRISTQDMSSVSVSHSMVLTFSGRRHIGNMVCSTVMDGKRHVVKLQLSDT
jgi:hypothetical protein